MPQPFGDTMLERVNFGDALAKRHSFDPAIIDCRTHGTKYSFQDVFELSGAVAQSLRLSGASVGSRIGILSDNRVEYIIAYLGIMRAGMIATPINQRLSPSSVQSIIREVGLDLVFVDRDQRPIVPSGTRCVCFDDDWTKFVSSGAMGASMVSAVHSPTDVATILFTSGSTGMPKGVQLTHTGLVWAMNARRRANPGFGRHRVLVSAPLYHMNALLSAAFSIYEGATTVLLPGFSAASYLSAIGEHKCSWLTSVPTMIAMVVREREHLPDIDVSSVEVVAMGSAPVTDKLIDDARRVFANARVSIGYGTTEIGPSVFGPHPDGIDRPVASLGHPMPGVDVRLVSLHGEDASEGNLQVRSPAMTIGYIASVGTIAAVDEAGWYDTKDIMRRDSNGFFYFVSRVDNMFTCGGENVYPEAVERLLERHPGIRQACVVPMPDELKGAKPVAFVVSVAGASISEDELKRFALDHGPAYQHPRRIIFCTELPLTAAKKVDRAELKKSFEEELRTGAAVGND
jgi:acyl-CoA synthetase (AMP-forming)/AMP-acid ligase II